jgi:hypothetical protein
MVIMLSVQKRQYLPPEDGSARPPLMACTMPLKLDWIGVNRTKKMKKLRKKRHRQAAWTLNLEP